LYANNATRLLSNFEVNRHMKVIPVVTYMYMYIISARQLAPVRTRYTNRDSPQRTVEITKPKRPTTSVTTAQLVLVYYVLLTACELN